MIELLPYQQKWVDDKSPFKMCLHRRRVGMSFAEAYGVVTTVRSGINCIVVTPRYYANWLSEIGYIAADQGLSFTKSYKTGCVTLSFKNDNFVALISENSLDELRGFAGKVVIDDAIWIDELDRIFHMVMPLLFFGDSQISVISAIDTFEKKPASFDAFIAKWKMKRFNSLHTITFEQAIADGLYEKIIESNGGMDKSKEDFIQNYNDVCGTDEEVFAPFEKAKLLLGQ